MIIAKDKINMTKGESYISIENITLSSTGKVYALGSNTEPDGKNSTASYIPETFDDILFNSSALERTYVKDGQHQSFYFTGLKAGTEYVIYIIAKSENPSVYDAVFSNIEVLKVKTDGAMTAETSYYGLVTNGENMKFISALSALSFMMLMMIYA